MKKTIHEAEDAVLHRMCRAIGRGIQLESKEAKEQANKWARAWQDKYLKLSRLVEAQPRTLNTE